MSFGKLYGFEGNARTTVLLVLAKENKLDIEFVVTDPMHGLSDEYKKLNPLRRVPTFEAPNGWVLTEVIAIAIYFASQNEQTMLFGETKQDYAQIIRWMSFLNTEVDQYLSAWFRPLLGRDPYNKKNVEEAKRGSAKVLAVLEAHLLNNTFFVGERLTLADLFSASIMSRGFQVVLDQKWRDQNPCTSRWFRTVVNQPVWRAVVPTPIFVDKALQYAPSQKVAKS